MIKGLKRDDSLSFLLLACPGTCLLTSQGWAIRHDVIPTLSVSFTKIIHDPLGLTEHLVADLMQTPGMLEGIKAFILTAEAVQWLHTGDPGHPRLQSRQSHKG